MTDTSFLMRALNNYTPRNYATMTDREKEIVRAYFEAGRSGGYPSIARTLAEEIIATEAYEAGKNYEASLK